MQEQVPPTLVLLLGAGASVAAGVPATVAFVHDFLEETDLPKELREWIEEFRGRQPDVDVEDLLRTMTLLAAEHDTPELLFLNRKTGLPSATSFSEWISTLERFIRAKCFVPPEKVAYLEPFRRLLANYKRPLDIFTANYDTAVEVFCLSRGIPFNNGFRKVWQPELLEEEESYIRLYKIHGSVTWWSTDEGTVVEIPVKIEDPQTHLYYGVRAQTLVIYPGTPSKVVQPSLELLPFLRKRLLTADFCVVAGYSLRDLEVRRILLDAVRDNPRLAIILVGPSAFEVYEEQLRWSGPDIPSVVAGVVSVLPFRFEAILPRLQDDHLRHALHGLERYRSIVAASEQYGSEGKPDEWSYTCEALARAGFIELAAEILERFDTRKWGLEYHLRALVHTLAIAAWARADEVVKDLERKIAALAERFGDSVRIATSGDGLQLTFVFKTNEGSRHLSEVLSWFKELLADVAHYQSMTRLRDQDHIPDAIESLKRRLTSLILHLEGPWGGVSGQTPLQDHWDRWKSLLAGELSADEPSSETLSKIRESTGVQEKIAQVEGKFMADLLR